MTLPPSLHDPKQYHVPESGNTTSAGECEFEWNGQKPVQFFPLLWSLTAASSWISSIMSTRALISSIIVICSIQNLQESNSLAHLTETACATAGPFLETCSDFSSHQALHRPG